MSKKNKGIDIHGWLIIDKPVGMTSTAVVAQVKQSLSAKKVGHGGTLDPFATGILPIALGEATKTTSYIMDGLKEYHFTIKWGQSTDSLDCDGDILTISDPRPNFEQIEDILSRFMGEIDQMPPDFSALKVNGQRAYDIARKGEKPALSSRKVWIENLELVDQPDMDHARLIVRCGKGTYIRALARDIASALGCDGHLCTLRRTAVGSFALNDTITLEDFIQTVHKAPLSEFLLPIERALTDILAIPINEDEAYRLRQGQAVSLFRKNMIDEIMTWNDDQIILATHKGQPIALTAFNQGQISPVRNFNL